MEHLCAICAIEHVMTTFMKANLLKHRMYGCQYKYNYHLELNAS